MARTALTVTNLNSGGTGTVVELTGLLSAANADGHSIVNNSDRRTFIIIKNASGAQRTIDFDVTATLDGDAGANNDPVDFRDDVNSQQGKVRVLLADATTKVYGPFRENIFNQSDDTVHVDFDSVTSVTCAAFKLPYTRANASQGLHRTDSGVSVTIESVSAQSVTVDGLEPTFTDHDQTNGWLMPVHRANRRFLWVKNTTGAQRTLVSVGTAYLTPITDSGTANLIWMWRSNTIENNEEFLMGGWDPIAWDYSGSQEMRFYALSGPHANLDIAWLELSP